MFQVILNALYYCCYRERPRVTTEAVIEHLERLAEHEVKFIVNQVVKKYDRLKSCC